LATAAFLFLEAGPGSPLRIITYADIASMIDRDTGTLENKLKLPLWVFEAMETFQDAVLQAGQSFSS